MIVDSSRRAAPVHSSHATPLRGRADLVFTRRGGKTVLAHSRIEAPMAVIRPFALQDGGLAVQLISLGPGLCGGDAIAIDITVEDNAHVVVTTTAATRVLSMELDRQAEHHVRLRAGRDASLEYYPAITIPYPGSALVQTVTVAAAASSRVGVLEAWALGRAARGEYLQFRSLSSRSTLSVEGANTYADAMNLDPAVTDAAGAGILAGRRYVAAGFWHGVSGIAEPGTEPVDGRTLVAFAQSRPDLAYLRALGDDGPELEAALRRSLERVAMAWRLPAVHMDRFRS